MLLILAGVTIATLTGDNGILTRANNAKVENTHATVREAISLAYSEYQIEINAPSSSEIKSSQKIASTEVVQIRGQEIKATEPSTTTFWDFLVGKRYINSTTGIIDIEELIGEKLSLGNGTGNNDVYKIEEESGGYILRYYTDDLTYVMLWRVGVTGLLESELKEKLDLVEEDAGIDSYGNIIDLNDWEYTFISEDTFSLENVRGTDAYPVYTGEIVGGVLNVPTFIKDNGNIYKLTEIGQSAFENCEDLVSIVIPETVTSIDMYAFSRCTNLTSITISKSINSVGVSAFDQTQWYENQSDGLIYVGNALYSYKGEMPENTSIEIRENTVSISSNAFNGYRELVSVTIPESVVEIGWNAFGGCTNLTSITINKPKDSITDAKWGANNAIITWTNGVTE